MKLAQLPAQEGQPFSYRIMGFMLLAKGQKLTSRDCEARSHHPIWNHGEALFGYALAGALRPHALHDD